MPTKSLNALALPLVISFTFRFLFTLVDLIYAAEIRDEVPYGVAAIGLFIPIQTLFIALWVGLSAGFTRSISQAFGRHDQTRVDELKRAMIRINVPATRYSRCSRRWSWRCATSRVSGRWPGPVCTW